VRFAKPIAIAFVVYVGIVAAFESFLRYFQPRPEGTIVITTTNEAGEPRRTVVSRLEIDGTLYVAANHWPRVWYTQALENPEVRVTMDGETRDYVAVPVAGEEYDRVNEEHRRGLAFKVLTGFPPRRILRLDSR
jgi:deazaflavin-dependent oxidoreductase (nitroreductase family)